MEVNTRNFLGYANHFPNLPWKGGARLAINFVLNYEEGSERNILDGDETSEDYLTDLPGVTAVAGGRHLSSESMFEYGSRAGVWRLLNLFDEYKIPCTLFATGLALQRNPLLTDYLTRSGHEVAGHGYRWINYRDYSFEAEQADIVQTIMTIKQLTGKQPIGWYTGRKSMNTRRIIVANGLQYDSDSYNDDLPYWVQVDRRPHLIIPYVLDTNDARYAITPGFSSGQDFLAYLKLTLNNLYREGAKHPTMMTIALHARISGRPGRAEVIRLFLDELQCYKDIWICLRADIATWWYEHYKEDK